MAQIGPTVVGRLKGAAYRIALKIRVKRQDGSILTLDDAIVAQAEPQVTDPLAGDVQAEATVSGIQQTSMICKKPMVMRSKTCKEMLYSASSISIVATVLSWTI